MAEAAGRGDDSSSLASAVLAMLAWLDALAMTPAFWYSPTLRSKKLLRGVARGARVSECERAWVACGVASGY